jgi:hypothetical protein
MADRFPPGGMGNFPGTKDQDIRAAKLFLDAPLLPGKYLQSNAQGFGGLKVLPVQTIHAAYQNHTHINSLYVGA